MSTIYEPKGKAREYSPLAMNLIRGCDHGCTYCYVPGIFVNDPTYVHLGPVIDTAQTLMLIRQTKDFIDQYKVGKLNHVPNATDWHAFLVSSVTALRATGKPFYVKQDLAKHANGFHLMPEETDMDRLCVPPFDTEPAELF